MGSHDLVATSGLTKGGMPGATFLVTQGAIDVTSLMNNHMIATFQMTGKDSQGNNMQLTEGMVDVEKYY